MSAGLVSPGKRFEKISFTPSQQVKKYSRIFYICTLSYFLSRMCQIWLSERATNPRKGFKTFKNFVYLIKGFSRIQLYDYHEDYCKTSIFQ